MGYLTILSKIGDALIWAYSHPRLALELALVSVLLLVGWRYNRAQDALSKAKLEAGELEKGLKQQISIVNGQLEILKREGGRTTVERRYVPPEGSVVVKQKDLEQMHKDYQALLTKLASATTAEERDALKKEIERLLARSKEPDTEIVVKDHGFTLRPGMGMSWSGHGISPRLDLKLAYFKRYSLLLGGDRDGVDIGASRHLDDILWWHPQNIEAFGAYRFFRIPEAGYWSLGLRLSF